MILLFQRLVGGMKILQHVYVDGVKQLLIKQKCSLKSIRVLPY